MPRTRPYACASDEAKAAYMARFPHARPIPDVTVVVKRGRGKWERGPLFRQRLSEANKPKRLPVETVFSMVMGIVEAFSGIPRVLLLSPVLDEEETAAMALLMYVLHKECDLTSEEISGQLRWSKTRIMRAIRAFKKSKDKRRNIYNPELQEKIDELKFMLVQMKALME